jgi:uncharacterized membrane protein
MNNSELIIIYTFPFVVFFILIILRMVVFRNSASASFLMKRKWNNIIWEKIFKYWAIIQGFIILSKMDSLYDDLFFVITTPIILICFLLVHTFTYNVGSNVENGEYLLLQQKEFEDYKKTFNRQKKIDKIIKRF